MKIFKGKVFGGVVFACLFAQTVLAESAKDRLANNFNAREEAAFLQLYSPISGIDTTFDIFASGNGDENLFGDLFAASFTKGFEHDSATGLVTTQGAASFKQLVKAMESGAQADFNAIVRAQGASKFVSPQTSLMFSLEGRAIQFFPGFQPPKINSPEAAAQMAESYLQAICRHVNFQDYGTGLNTDADGNGGSITQNAADILNGFGEAFKGPRDPSTEIVTSKVLFRGISQGAIKGPYVSQFALQQTGALYPLSVLPQNKWTNFIRTQRVPAVGTREFGVTWNDFVQIENGTVPRPYNFDVDFDVNNPRYPINGADMTMIFHQDGPCEAFYYAAQILAQYKFPQSTSLPYFNGTMPNEGAFVSSGPVEFFSILAAASLEAIQAVWAYKWLAHRNLRPEAFGGLVHLAKTTGNNQFNIHSSLINNDTLLNWVLAHNQKQAAGQGFNTVDNLSLQDVSTYLLSQQYPEGSPLHPSYLSGHAGIAGACVTVLKAYFKGDELIKNHMTPVMPDPNNPMQLTTVNVPDADTLTVNDELNKLAANACLGSRNFSGIHYRCDADDGCLLGEQVAIQWLIDQARKHREEKFTGFEITKFNGAKIRITKDGVTSGAKP